MAGAQEQAPDAFHFFQRNLAVGGDFFVADAELLAGVLPQFGAAGEQATDVGADLHVRFPQRLAMQHGVVAEHFLHLQRLHAHAARDFLHQFLRHGADLVLRVQQHRHHRRALPARRIALHELVESRFKLR